LYGPGEPYKPGHWTAVSLEEAQANHFDFLGELAIWPDGRNLKPIPLSAVGFHLAASREVALPKGQPKFFESAMFVPPSAEDVSAHFELSARRGGRRVYEGNTALARMPSYQYHFIVLTRQSDRYKYLETIPSIRPPGDLLGEDKPYYRVTLMPARLGRRLALPSHALFWTSIACVLWDDAEPSCLDLQQQQALLDWLHWGGHLILSGPDTLDTLRDSFLGPYLPTMAADVRKIGAGDLRDWKDLVVARRVGRGRIVASAFRLSGADVTSRPGWDNFFNDCLLRRAPRMVTRDEQGEVRLDWADDPQGRRRFDAGRICSLRYFSRDAGVGFDAYGADVRAMREAEDAPTRLPPGTGVAAWNDFGAVAGKARASLLSAARVEVPPRSFVLWVVAGYLLVLVPANWVVFRLLRRVQWAWAATPLIAVACTVVVIRMAQLDIGFVRSRTEIAVLEIQADYTRAHLTRYTALYTSLTTAYDFHLADPGGVMQPFPEVADPSQFRMPTGATHKRLDYQRGQQAGLRGFSVDSNSVALLHSEQMLEVGGPLALVEESDDRFVLHNQSQLTLHGAGVVKKTAAGDLRTAWLGTVKPGAKVPLPWTLESATHSGSRLWQQQRDAAAMTARRSAPGELHLRGLTDLAQNVAGMQPDDVRLIAWLEGELPGFTIHPAAPQSRCAALVIAHLRHGDGWPPTARAEQLPARVPGLNGPRGIANP